MNRYIVFLLKCMCAAVFFGAIYVHVSAPTMPTFKQPINLFLLFLAGSCICLQSLAVALRWNLVLRTFGVELPLYLCIRIFWVGMFFNSYMPLSIAGDGVKAWMLQKNGVSWPIGASAIFVNRVAGLLILVVATLLSLPFFKGKFDDTMMLNGLLILTLSLLIIIAILGYLEYLPLKWKSVRFVRVIFSLSPNIRSFWCSPRTTSKISSAGLFAILCQISSIYLLIKALHLQLTYADCLCVVPSMLLVMALPISIGGWGPREAVSIVIFGYFGVPATSALLLSILYGCLVLLVSLPGALIWLLLRMQAKASGHKMDASELAV